MRRISWREIKINHRGLGSTGKPLDLPRFPSSLATPLECLPNSYLFNLTTLVMII